MTDTADPHTLENDLRALKADLPNFPENVIEIWLKTYVGQHGWPPGGPRDRRNSWRYLLGVKDLSFWKSVRWVSESRPLEFGDFVPLSRDAVNSLINAYVNDVPNLFKLQIPDGKARYRRSMAYLVEHGRFPEPIVCLDSRGHLEVLDGNHRVAAYFVYKKLRENPDTKILFKDEAAELAQFIHADRMI